MHSIELSNVSKTFGSTKAVNNLSFQVPKGKVYGFIGPNGSGKTTTIRMIMNILYPDSGEINILGDSYQNLDIDRIGYLPEERGLYTRMKVRELLTFYGKLRGTENVKREVDDWLEKMDLTDWANKKVETLSKGMSQKVQFIVTVIAKPEIIILDEPFSGLDPVNAEVIRKEILELQKKGTTVIFSTHDMNVAEKLCDFILMIYKGKKVLDGTLDDIQDQYGTDTVRIRTEAGMSACEGIPGIDRINDFGKSQELRLSENADPQEILKALMRHTKILKFDIVKPSLNDIFIRIAGPEAKEVVHA